MTEPIPDLDKLLSRANPVDETRLPLPVDHPTAQLLYEKITGSPYAGPARPSRRRLGTFMAAIAALAVVGGGAAYAGLRPSRISAHLSVVCYSQPSLESRAASVTATADGPIAACAGAWAAGNIGHGAVPLLAACVAPTGIAAVFPTAPDANICAQLGLAALPATTGATPKSTTNVVTTTDTVDRLIGVRNAIVNSLQGQCLDAATARATVTDILKRSGLPWTVSIPNPFPPEHPCASPAFDEAGHHVLLIGIPRQG